MLITSYLEQYKQLVLDTMMEELHDIRVQFHKTSQIKISPNPSSNRQFQVFWLVEISVEEELEQIQASCKLQISTRQDDFRPPLTW